MACCRSPLAQTDVRIDQFDGLRRHGDEIDAFVESHVVVIGEPIREIVAPIRKEARMEIRPESQILEIGIHARKWTLHRHLALGSFLSLPVHEGRWQWPVRLLITM